MSPMIRLRVGELLIRRGLITEEQLERALKEQARTGRRIGDILVDLGYINRETLENVLKEYKASLEDIEMDIDPDQIDRNLAKIVPEKIASMFKVVPIKLEGDTIWLASTDILDVAARDYIRFATGYNVRVILTSEGFVESVYEALYSSQSKEELLKDLISETEEELAKVGEATEVDVIEDETSAIAVASVEELASQAPVIRLVNYLITEAVERGASDVHIEPYENKVRVRYRIDGVLEEQMTVPTKLRDAIVARVKIMSRLNVVERRVPQDGRIKIRVKDKEVDVRVSTVPTVTGEKVVMRLLDKSGLVLDLDLLGFEEDQREIFERAIKRPYGMVLITGPTGSGKTTTLYSALKILNRPQVNIMTVEDPVEYNFEGINQVNVNEAVGLDFAAALRAFLRQDPDIILVGEIRDKETVEIAIRAALTGHLVFSTVHTNNAPATVTRLVDMGVEPFLVASSLILVVAQRLVRKICPLCKEEYVPSEEVLRVLGLEDEKGPFYRGKGCSNCRQTGYKGRIAVYELMEVTQDIKKAIVSGATEDEIRDLAVTNGMKLLKDVGVEKARRGVTTLEEVIRAIS